MAIVTTTLGVTLFLLVVSVLAMMSRINLLVRQLDAILVIFKDADAKMENAAQSEMGESPESGLQR